MHLASYGLALLEGFGIILSPCILPILPIVLSLGIEGPKGRPYGIILGFITAFSTLTLISRQLVSSLGIDIEIIRYASFVLLFIFGLILISDYLSDRFLAITQRFTSIGERVASRQSSNAGFWGGLILGVGIGFIWVPCAGPIMAAVIVQTVIQQTTIDTVLTLMSFSVGAALPMLVLILMGRRIMDKLSIVKSSTHVIRKILGAIIIISVIYSVWPIKDVSATSKPFSQSELGITGLKNGLPIPYPAPQIDGIVSWINSQGLQMDQLRGKVVLIDFWTYSCINCIRTLPYLTKWDAVYRDKGLVIIGVHAPEFAFERKIKNVQEAVKKYNIQYAVALDNDFKTWRNFQNSYWPAHYLIDRQGNVVYTHFGEGNYDVTESNIRFLLGLTPDSQQISTKGEGGSSITPETYLGYERAERFMQGALAKDQSFDYPASNALSVNEWGLEGKWLVDKQRITAQEASAKLKLHFHAKKVFLVLGTNNGQSVSAKISLNGQPIEKFAGADVQNNIITVSNETLYELVNLDSLGDGILELQPMGPGLQAYAFTFGG